MYRYLAVPLYQKIPQTAQVPQLEIYQFIFFGSLYYLSPITYCSLTDFVHTCRKATYCSQPQNLYSGFVHPLIKGAEAREYQIQPGQLGRDPCFWFTCLAQLLERIWSAHIIRSDVLQGRRKKKMSLIEWRSQREKRNEAVMFLVDEKM